MGHYTIVLEPLRVLVDTFHPSQISKILRDSNVPLIIVFQFILQTVPCSLNSLTNELSSKNAVLFATHVIS